MKNTLSHHWYKDKILILDYFSPKSANSLSVEALEEIIFVLKSLKPKALLFTSSHPRVYCSGGDLKRYASMKEEESRNYNQKIRHLLNEFCELPIYTVAHISGDCFGGGIEFLSCFDLISSKPYCLFGFWQKKQALSFGWGGFKRLSRRLSEKQLICLLQNAEVLQTSKALKLGLIDLISDNQDLVLQNIEKVISNESYRLIKKIDLSNEVNVFEKLWFSEEHQEKLKKIKKIK